MHPIDMHQGFNLTDVQIFGIAVAVLAVIIGGTIAVQWLRERF